MNNKTKITFLCVAILMIGISTGTWLGYSLEKTYSFLQTKKLVTNILPVRENNFNYKFIYPLLRYNFGDARYFFEDKKLEQPLTDYIQQQYQEQNAESISVYFSNFRDGTWAGVNEETQYHPASMMKVLIMMAYYRELQLDDSIMKRALLYAKNINQVIAAESFASPSNLTVGKSYTTKDLIEDMIDNSDNGAERLLLANVNQEILNDVYRDLNVSVPGEVQNYTISSRDYSTFLRILYSATYLSEVNSEDALLTMSKSTFHDGIYAGVPSGIQVAQKYGEYVSTDSRNKTVTSTELHNCGIIYTKSYAYELCVMTKGKGAVNQSKLTSIIKDISAIVYNYVDKNGT